jgi:hypothetical protein
MNTDLIGMTREHAMHLAAELTISGSAEHVIELLRQAQWTALIAFHGVRGARELVASQDRQVA